MDGVHPEVLLDAAAPVLKEFAESHGYQNLAVFGSVTKRTAQPGSDIDLIVEAPESASTFDFLKFKELIEKILNHKTDLISQHNLRDDIRREAVIL